MLTLEVRDVTVFHKDVVGIKNASLKAKNGEIIGFIGADGAGKSSLMHAISGVKQFIGEIVFDNFFYRSVKDAEPIKKHIGFMPQGIGLVLYETLTVEEHLNFFANIRGIRQDKEFIEYKNQLLHMAGLSSFTDRKAMNLSGGMMQKLSLICTLLHRPKLLILDEPTTGVDPLSRLELWEILDDIRKKEGTIVLVSTAYMQEAEKMDQILLFDEGEIIATGTSSQLLSYAEPYSYEPVSCFSEECIETGLYTYSLNRLNTPKKRPNLEALFFINALQKKRKVQKIRVGLRDDDIKIPETVMEAKGLTKNFDSFVANDNIDMTLKRGEILGLLGANGAGKTTFIKMLLGLYPIDQGSLTILGHQIKSFKDRQALKAHIGYVSQHFALYKDLTVRENLLYFANMHKIPIKVALERIQRYAEELSFSEYMDLFPTELPLGINQRFSIASALIHEPVVLFLDEPTSGVDAIARSQFWQILRQLKEVWGISILITTHYMSEAEFCDRVVLLKQGKKIADDSVKNFYRQFPHTKSFEDIFLQLYKGQE
ncbi:ATP-binding cassette domain-containing protein [Hydrogenimonas thermophila]|uniref:ATP-binding cassette domain-containing protein n=1 Tax=Hydrogenimonas thermophila TaxID=223786 RepID=UPI0029370AAC|nr:ATP-binding cassette domain-containing protein [Hydrogenimonas thermophila]WOE70786.1 ATP-binding cassette domain-containing protein [Hydrogenimonas thermophila]WOE73304.1 ATP-binding cassette domain-containing protein [Hydrogenimonas thermophila]